MKMIHTKLQGLAILEPRVFADARGWFYESWSACKLRQAGFEYEFVQDNHSSSLSKGTLRGLHFQNNPSAQGKLVRCTRGAILDVAVDLRRGSPTWRQWVAVELNANNYLQLLVPKGFAHGFLTLTDDAEVQYKADAPYSPEHDRSIRWNDPEIGVAWGISNPILSEKDAKAPFLSESDVNFEFLGGQ